MTEQDKPKCHYTPGWKDSAGNIMCFPMYEEVIFDTRLEAEHAQHALKDNAYRTMGLHTADVIELPINHKTNKYDLPNVKAKLGGKWPVMYVAGPLFDRALGKQDGELTH